MVMVTIEFLLLYIVFIDHAICVLAQKKQASCHPTIWYPWATLISLFHNYVFIEHLLNNLTQKKA
jgi:hypothetical protein